MVVTLGALLADVPHRRPVSIIGTASDQALVDPVRPPAVALRRADRHRRVPARRLHRRRHPVGVAVGHRAGLRARDDVAEGGAGPRASGRRRSSARPCRRAQPRAATWTSTSARSTSTSAGDDDLPSYVERLERLVDEGRSTTTTTSRCEPTPHPAEDAGSVERLVAEVEQFLRDQGPEG